MKKKLVLITAMLSALFWISCKKDNGGVNPPPGNQPPANSLIKTRTTGATIEHYEYDATGKVLKVIKEGNVSPDYTFQYNGNSINMKRFKPDGTIWEDKTYVLNDKGLIIESSDALLPLQITKFEYDAAGREVKQINYGNGVINSVTHRQYKDGNRISDSTFQSNGNFSHARHNEYYTQFISTTEAKNSGEAFWGAGNKNPYKKITYTNSSGNVTGTQDFALPELDNLFRIKKFSYQSNGTGTPVIREYTYY